MSEEENCRHEYVIIYQRRLKGLDRRLLSTRAYLPVGFNMNDFKHLSEGSFCFCSKCRKRLFPKKSKAEKLAARIERKRLKEEQLAKLKAEAEGSTEEENSELSEMNDSSDDLSFGLGKAKAPVQEEDEDEEEDDDDYEDDEKLSETEMNSDEVDEDSPELEVDELEVESVDVEDIKAEGVKLSSDDDLDASCDMDEEDES